MEAWRRFHVVLVQRLWPLPVCLHQILILPQTVKPPGAAEKGGRTLLPGTLRMAAVPSGMEEDLLELTEMKRVTKLWTGLARLPRPCTRSQ